MSRKVLDKFKDINAIVDLINKTDYKYDKSTNIVEIFQKCAKTYPDRCAIKFYNKSYTYKEIDELTDIISENMISQGIQCGDIIGIYMEKSDEYIIAILSILKCNCIYLPLSRVYPLERIISMLQIAQAKAIVFDKIEKEELEKLNLPISFSYNSLVVQKHTNLVKKINNKCGSAYILFTSGSTGKPKGIEIKQSSVINLVNSIKDKVLHDQQVKIIGVLSPFVFDVSVGQIYLALLTGNTLDIIPDDIKMSCELFYEYLSKRNLHCLEITPTRLEAQLNYNETINMHSFPRYLISCGEALPLGLCKRYFELVQGNQYTLLNYYGPTETCVYSTVMEINGDSVSEMDRMLIGKPIYNTQVYILNQNLELCPIGVKGELFIGGDGLAVGYVNQQELTNRSFIQSPFDKNKRIYKTGDIAQYTDSGDIEYFGRVDDQIKLRGFRIELSEIEDIIKEIKGITLAKAIVVRENEQDVLVLYYLDRNNVSYETIKTHCKKYLPYYMIPNYFVPVKNFEYTVNGKLDKSKLPDYRICALKTNTISKEFIVDHYSEELLKMCKEVLKVRELTLYDNFISMGGDSLAAMTLNSQIKNHWNVMISMINILSCESIGDIADKIRQEAIKGEKIEKLSIEGADEAFANTMQKIVLDYEAKLRKSESDNTSADKCNMIYAVKSSLYLNASLFENALKKMVLRHSMLRTTFFKVSSKYKMKRHDNCTGYFEFIKVEEDVDTIELKKYVQYFDVSKLPLFKITLFEDTNLNQIMLFDFNHAIFDFMSLRIFINDVFAYYNNIELPKIKRDVYHYYNSVCLKKSEESIKFWKKKLYRRDHPVCLSPDKGDKKLILHNDDVVLKKKFIIEKRTLDLIRNKCNDIGITEYIYFSSSIILLLSAFENKRDIIIGTNVIGCDREHMSELSVIGLFTKLVPMRCKLDNKLTIKDILVAQSEEFLDVLKHSDLEIDDIFTSMDINDMVRGDLFKVIFNFTSDYNVRIPYDNRYIQTIELGKNPEGTPIYFSCVTSAETVIFELSYIQRLFSEDLILKIINTLINIFQLMSQNLHISLEEFINKVVGIENEKNCILDSKG
ncbi:amino acid adenylation domain-containing protein [Ruminiclostridium herbifermentans]|uniref:Amino acid adenylation domain-containing protein n=1 Tax=Ruminiclostridium herbifermentans TaxID=2488810 RepID=A0A4U7JLL3_9FIRM|nr:amino acid adenylation domain-containing protein [Ruminiclostridium herbifermentans]QNU66069.1 amino acid adenylation domain-containing protein [Ruminiclostridium herbifermentans]